MSKLANEIAGDIIIAMINNGLIKQSIDGTDKNTESVATAYKKVFEAVRHPKETGDQ